MIFKFGTTKATLISTQHGQSTLGWFSIMTKGTWLPFDYQYITNPAYNADRGPVRIIGGRLHLEY